MNRKRLFMAIIAVCALVVFPAATALAGSSYFEQFANKKKIVFGLNASYPPFAIWTEKGPVGMDVEFAKEIAKVLDVPDCEFVKVRPQDAAEMLEKGEVDVVIAALSLTPQRLKKVAFSIPYVNVSQAALLSRSKIPQVIIGEVLRPMPVESYNDLSKLEPLRIGAKQGTDTMRRAQEKFKRSKVIGFEDAGSLGQALLDGKIDAVVHEDPYVRYFAIANKSRGGKFVALTKKVSEEGLCVVYRYGDPDFARFLDGLILYLRQKGTFARWELEFFDGDRWMEGVK